MARSAFFCRSRFGTSGKLFLGIAAASALLQMGCDSDTGKANKRVTEQLDAATVQMSGSSASDMISANHALDEASRESTASLPQQLRAKALLADSELQLTQGFVSQLQTNDAAINRLAREITLLGNEIQSNNQQYAVLAKADPTALQDAVKQNSQQVTGSDDKPDWYKSDTTTLQSMSADDKQAATVQSAISALQDKIKTESDQRNQLLDQADKLNMQSQHEQSGDKSTDLYKQGSVARKQAADLTVAIDQDSALLAHVQADLAVLQTQHDSTTSALKSLNDKSSLFDTAWKSVQDEQAALTENSKKIMGDDPVDAPKMDPKTGNLKTEFTIGSKASAINELAKKNYDELRSNAETHFNNAISFYKEAFDLATKIKSDLMEKTSKFDSQKPDQLAWSAEQNAFDPGTYRYLQADAKLQKAEFSATLAAELKTRFDLDEWLKPIVQSAQLNLFPTLDDSDSTLASNLKKAQSAARDDYKDAAELFTNVNGDTNSAELKTAAEVQQIFTQYGWYVLESAAGDKQEAANHLSMAKNAVIAAQSDSAMLPTLPKELASVKPSNANGTASPGGMPAPGAPAFPPR